MLGPVSTWWVTVGRWVSHHLLWITSLSCQLSLAITPSVDAMKTSESLDVYWHTMWCTGPISVVSHFKLMFSQGLRKRVSALPCGPFGLRRTLLFYILLSDAQTMLSLSVKRRQTTFVSSMKNVSASFRPSSENSSPPRWNIWSVWANRHMPWRSWNLLSNCCPSIRSRR